MTVCAWDLGQMTKMATMPILYKMVNKWLGAINNSQMIGMVMIDFRKAFDLVDHTLLLKKLKYYKISEETISWFSSYLMGRKQSLC